MHFANFVGNTSFRASSKSDLFFYVNVIRGSSEVDFRNRSRGKQHSGQISFAVRQLLRRLKRNRRSHLSLDVMRL